MKRLPLTPAEIEFAKAARQSKRPWRHIAKILRADDDTVKRAVLPGFAEERAARIRQNRKDRTRRDNSLKRDYGAVFRAIPGRDRPTRGPDIPDDIMLQRDARLSAPRTLTAILCGDPLPGQSALDKRRMNLSTAPPSDPDDKVGLSP